MTDDGARSRFMALTMLRVTGVALAVFGVAIIARKIDLPEIAGIAFVLVGAFDVLVMPVILARKWKSPRP